MIPTSKAAKPRTAGELDKSFTPDLKPEQLSTETAALYHGMGKQLAGMKAEDWPDHWKSEPDSLGFLDWYKKYDSGRRIADDKRQIGRWRRFKAINGKAFVENPTPRRAFSLRNWGIDPLKLLPDEKRTDFQQAMNDFRTKVMNKDKSKTKRAFLGGLFGGKEPEPQALQEAPGTMTPMRTNFPGYLNRQFRHFEQDDRFSRGPYRESTLGEYFHDQPLADEDLWNMFRRMDGVPPEDLLSGGKKWDAVSPLILNDKGALNQDVTFGQIEDAAGDIEPLDDYWRAHQYAPAGPPKTAALITGITGKTAAGSPFPARMMGKLVPVGERRDVLEPDEEAEVAAGKSQWFPKIIQHDDTPIPSMLASPGKHSVLTGLMGALGGGAIGAGLAYGATKLFPDKVPQVSGGAEGMMIRSGIRGALGGALGFGALGYKNQDARNAHIEEGMRRLPPGATKRDFNNEEMLTRAMTEKFAARKPGLAMQPQGYDAMEGALGFYDAARSLARPTDRDLGSAGLNRDKFNTHLGNIADQLVSTPPAQMNSPYSAKGLQRNPRLSGGIAAAVGSAIGLGAGTVGDQGLAAKAGLTVAGGLVGYLAGEVSARNHNADLTKTMKVMRNYGMNTPTKVMRAMPIVADSKYDKALMRGLR